MRGRRFLGSLLFLTLVVLLVREFVHRWSTYYEHGSLRPPYAVLHPAYYGQLALWIDPVPCASSPGCTTVVHRTAHEIVQETAEILGWEAQLWHYFRWVRLSHGPDSCPAPQSRLPQAKAWAPDIVVVLDLMPPKPSCCLTLRRLLGYIGLRPLRRGYRISYLAQGPGAERSRCLARAVDSTLKLAGFWGFHTQRLRPVVASQEPRLAPYATHPAATILLEFAPCDSDYEKLLRAKWIRRWMMRTVLAGITVYLSQAHACHVEPRVSHPEGVSSESPVSATTALPPYR